MAGSSDASDEIQLGYPRRVAQLAAQAGGEGAAAEAAQAGGLGGLLDDSPADQVPAFGQMAAQQQQEEEAAIQMLAEQLLQQQREWKGLGWSPVWCLWMQLCWHSKRPAAPRQCAIPRSFLTSSCSGSRDASARG